MQPVLITGPISSSLNNNFLHSPTQWSPLHHLSSREYSSFTSPSLALWWFHIPRMRFYVRTGTTSYYWCDISVEVSQITGKSTFFNCLRHNWPFVGLPPVISYAESMTLECIVTVLTSWLMTSPRWLYIPVAWIWVWMKPFGVYRSPKMNFSSLAVLKIVISFTVNIETTMSDNI